MLLYFADLMTIITWHYTKISAEITQAVWRLGHGLAGWPSSCISIHGIFHYPEPLTRFWGPTDHIFGAYRWIFPRLKWPGY